MIAPLPDDPVLEPACGTAKILLSAVGRPSGADAGGISADYKEQPAASDIHVTPDGKFLYGAERMPSMLTGYKIDPDKGTLTQIGRFSTEKTPRGFAIDPRGKFLLSVGMDSAGMTVYTIAQTSGELKPIGNYPMGMQPNWIEMVDLK